MWLLCLHFTLLTFERVPQIAVSVSHLHRVSPWLLRTEAGKPLLTMSVSCVALLGFLFFTQLEQLCMIHSSGTFGCTVQTWSWKSTWVLTSVPEAIIVHISTLSEFIQT